MAGLFVFLTFVCYKSWMPVPNLLIRFGVFASAMLWATSAITASAEMTELVVTGDPGQLFSGDCYLSELNRPLKRHRIKGRVPAHYLFPATAFRCNLEKKSAKGQLIAIVIRKGKKEYAQKSRYPLKWVVVQSSGPWGRAGGGTFAARPILK